MRVGTMGVSEMGIPLNKELHLWPLWVAVNVHLQDLKQHDPKVVFPLGV